MSIERWDAEFYEAILGSSLIKFLSEFSNKIESWKQQKHHDKQNLWHKQLEKLPPIEVSTFKLGDTLVIGDESQLDMKQKKSLEPILKNFMPWRKGPFNLFGTSIDTEWRSDWKWQRVLPHIQSLEGKRVLDVGCGSGYHLWRMSQQGAKQVIGVDPTTLFFYQFHCIKKYLPEHNVHFLPLGIEDLPETQSFDSVFSMGVLYHRLDPLLFLKQLKMQLKKGGQLVLETLVIEGDENQVLLPAGRYAQMRNVYFIPSSQAMIKWLEKVGFKNVSLVDENYTSVQEQRSTEWMPNHSLVDFLDPKNEKLTIEGYPAPCRATFVATK